MRRFKVVYAISPSKGNSPVVEIEVESTDKETAIRLARKYAKQRGESCYRPHVYEDRQKLSESTKTDVEYPIHVWLYNSGKWSRIDDSGTHYIRADRVLSMLEDFKTGALKGSDAPMLQKTIVYYQ